MPRIAFPLRLAAAAIFLSLFVGGACGALTTTGRCDVRKTSLGSLGYCYDMQSNNPGAVQFVHNMCDTLMTTWEPGQACEHVSAVGGCRVKLDLGGTATRWYYPDGKYKNLEALSSSGECSDGWPVDSSGTAVERGWGLTDGGGRQDAGSAGAGQCEPAVLAAGTCTYGLDWAYDCSANQESKAPEGACFPTGTVFCCPDPLCMRTTRQDALCGVDAGQKAWSCFGGYTPPGACTLAFDGGQTALFCCP